MVIPPFPGNLVHWYRMKVDRLTPDQYWECSVEDYELAVLVQNAVHDGREIAAEELRKEADAKREYEKKVAESEKRVAAKAGKL